MTLKQSVDKVSHPVLAALLGLGIVGSVLFLGVFQAALTENRNHTQTLTAILKIEATRKPAIKIGSNSQTVMVKSFDNLEKYLLERDWTLVEQMGGHILYSKTGARDSNTTSPNSVSPQTKARTTENQLSASCGMYSSLYMICDLSVDPDPKR